MRTAALLNKSGATRSEEFAARVIEKSAHKELQSPIANAMVALVLETALSGYGALIFCGSRQACHSNALLISEAMPDETLLDTDIMENRYDIIASLQSLPCGLDPIFEKTVVKGVAFHR